MTKMDWHEVEEVFKVCESSLSRESVCEGEGELNSCGGEDLVGTDEEWNVITFVLLSLGPLKIPVSRSTCSVYYPYCGIRDMFILD